MMALMGIFHLDGSIVPMMALMGIFHLDRWGQEQVDSWMTRGARWRRWGLGVRGSVVRNGWGGSR